jgi:hypothetical protein
MLPRPSSDLSQRPLTAAERGALSRHIPAGLPLSEIILEERNGTQRQQPVAGTRLAGAYFPQC